MCGMENSNLISEVKFIGDYHDLLTRLKQITRRTQTNVSEIGITRRMRKISTLESIKEAAIAGIQSTSLTNQVETFLSVTTIPGIQDAGKIVRGFPNEISALQGIDNNPAMTVLDLALTVDASYEQSATLLDLACKKCGVIQNEVGSSDSSSSRNRQRNTVLGYVHFGTNLTKLLKEINKFHYCTNILQNNVSLTELVSSEYLPLSIKSMKDYITFWKCLHDATAEFQTTLENTKIKEGTGSSKSNSKQIHKLKPHVVFRKFIEIFRGCAVDGKIYGNYIYYLHRLYSYLKLITTLIHQNLSPETDGMLSEWKKPGMYFELFSDSLVVLIGELVFGLNIAPSHLEPTAYKLKLNLVYSIVCNCSPKIPCSSSCSAVCHGYTNAKKWGQIILNHSQNWNGPVRHPEIAVRSLLTDVLQVIKKESENLTDVNENVLTYYHICKLAQNSNVKSVLTETCELAAIDLNLLVPGDETLVFYTNLANLMWIHSLIALEVMPAYEDYSVSHKNSFESVMPELSRNSVFGLFSLHSLERQISQKCVGYNVGNLGFVSLSDIYHQLLGGLNISATTVLKNYAVLGSIPAQKTTLIDSTSADPRVLFSLMNDHKQSPKFQVLFPESLDSQLDKNIIDYLNHSVRLNHESQELVIPDLLQLYQDYVLLNQEPESYIAVPTLTSVRLPYYFALEEDEDQITTLYNRERISQLIDFLKDNTSGDLQTQINKVFEANLTPQIDMSGTVVMIEKSEIGHCIVLDYDDRKDKATALNLTASECVWRHREVEPVLKFLERHCWLLSVLVQRIHQEKTSYTSEKIDKNVSPLMSDERIKCLEQLFNSEWIDTLRTCFQNNSVVAALHSRPNEEDLWFLLDGLVRKQEWVQCAKILWALPETDVLTDSKLQAFHDVVMYELASLLPNEGTLYPWWYCQQIVDADIQVQCLLQNLPQWPGQGCQQALKTVLESQLNTLSSEVKSQLKLLLHKISIYEKILSFTSSSELKNWYDVKCTSENNPSLIVGLLLEARELLTSLPVRHSTTVCKEIIPQLTSISCLKFITSFLVNSCISYLCHEELEKYHTLSIGIQMITVLSTMEQQQHWDLIWKPHLLMEQFIMNTRLEVLERMVSEVKPLLVDLPEESPISINNINSMLRLYAGKALDFRVIQKSTICRTFLTEEKLCVSLSIASQQSQEFTMPTIVPSKTDWVPNEAVTECMCCQSVAFSMFNRRHHCRRCGRVICATCSMQRTKVMGYGSVPVRVCDDCYQQMQSNEDHYMNKSMDENLPPFSLNSDESLNPDLLWKLTLDEEHNTTVREEFSYEYAPSVSLCLAILKLHSEHIEHPRFLLDACDRMLQLLQPVGPGTANPEVDYSLVIRMVRSLAIAAKVRHARAGHNSGVEQCDQLLSQVDLFNMLVKNGCSALVPAESLNAHGLRRLRDCLVEEEHWTLALDVSMKAGLDSNIVWAAWGKALLKTGCWNEAWEKFTHCFNKRPETSQPMQNPLLLNEIVQILEDGAYTYDHKFMERIEENKSKKNNPLSTQAQSVIQGLASLKEICQGKYPQATSPLRAVMIGPKINHLFYSECCRYLGAYGSNSGIISFYLHHDDLNAALRHVISKKVEAEMFFETIYIPCLREGLIADLHQALSSFDVTFTKWESYLGYVCRQLERKGMLNVLYQLQLYLKDYIRAAMSCIRFYQMGARNYTDLYLNLKYLQSADDHLSEGLSVIQNTGSKGDVIPHMTMKLNEKNLDRYIRIVALQRVVNTYLYECESEQLKVLELLPEILEHLQLDISKQYMSRVPTLFGNILDCMQIAVLVILCGKSVAEGFHISKRIIDCFNLKVLDVYVTAVRKLAHDKRHADIKQLIECIKSTSEFPSSDSLCDDILVNCLKVLGNKKESGDVESLVKLIIAADKRIQGYINCQLLKAAYLLAVKSKRISDVEKILQEARRLGQVQVERLCLQRLGQKEQQH